MPDIEELIDLHGNVRRPGSLEMPEGLVSAFPAFSSAVTPWPEEEIKRVVRDANRVHSRVLFGTEWLTNQASTSACNGHAGASAFSRARFKRDTNNLRVIFSGAWLYSLINGQQDNGSVLEHGMRAVQDKGLCEESLVPANMIFTRQQPANAAAEAAKHKGFQCFVAEDLEQLRTGLAAGYSGVVAIQAGSKFQRLDSQGVCGIDNGRGNHAVCVDDLYWEGGEWRYEMVNSWGPQFGQNGRGKLTDGHFTQTQNFHKFYLVPTTLEASL